MAERIAESGELAVDELKRKARRRLVGAIVLALGAAVLVPMLLEDEPRPLGDDVSVQIPSREDGKFVSRLTGAAPDAKSRTKSAPVSEQKAVPAETKAPSAEQLSSSPERDAKAPQSGSETAKAPRGQPDAAPAGAAVPPAQASAATAVTQPAAPAGQAAPAQMASPQPSSSPAASSQSPSPQPSSSPAAASQLASTQAAPTQAPSGFSVQLAAFSDDKGAKALANKLKRAGYAAYVEPVTTSRGTLWRVRVGGYATRSEADAARVTLKDEGYSGIVTAAK